MIYYVIRTPIYLMSVRRELLNFLYVSICLGLNKDISKQCRCTKNDDLIINMNSPYNYVTIKKKT